MAFLQVVVLVLTTKKRLKKTMIYLLSLKVAAARCALILSSTVLMSSTDYLKTPPHLAFTPAIISSKRRWKDSQETITCKCEPILTHPAQRLYVCGVGPEQLEGRDPSVKETMERKQSGKKVPITKQSRRGGEKLYVTIKKKQNDEKKLWMKN